LRRVWIDPDLAGGAPAVAATGTTVAEFIRTAYADGTDVARGTVRPALSAEELRAVIDYCADEACVDAGAFCPGCRKRTEAEGIGSLDQFCARFASIRFADTGLEMHPGGPRAPVTFSSLDGLAREWQGPECWFLARRLIRRLRQLEDPRGKRMAAAPEGAVSPALVLVRPQLADNIGMVARAMANFGLDELRIVAPRDGWPNEKARAAASGANFIIDGARAFGAVKDAVADFHFVCATTARQRDLAKPVLTPEQVCSEMRRRMDAGERCAILFGPERSGLETDEIAVADATVMAPVNPRFASLNLAQAVLLVSYEWLKETARGTLGRVTTYESALEPGPQTRGSPPATKDELIGLFEHLEGELDRLGFFNPPHKRQTVVRNLRTMLTRMGATEQEVRTLRGIVATLATGKGRGRKVP
jgi:tRNA/rRNA methyltransferase